MLKIIKDTQFLSQECQPCHNFSEGKEIAHKLIEAMSSTKFAIGLSANQLGIQKKVCVVWLNRDRSPRVFINPSYLPNSSKMFSFNEACLSFNHHCITLRHSDIIVSSLGEDEVTVYESYSARGPSSSLLLACLQHEIDHLYGYTMFDRECSM